MTHSASSSPPQHLTLRVWIAFIVVVAAALIGGWGMWRYETEYYGHADVLSVAYHSLQLFILHAPHLEHPVNWQIHVGRWLSALFVFWAVIRGLTFLFRSELRLRWTRWRGGHVIICGLGRLGRQLVAEFQRGGHRVIVIEANADNVAAAGPGAVVLIGDACNAEQLRQAGVAKAKQLIAVCDDVQTNVAIAATAGDVLRHAAARSHSDRKLESWLFVPDAQLRQLFKGDRLFPQTGSRFQVNVRGLDLFSLAARQALGANPLDFEPIQANSPTCVQFVIVGFGPMGQRLALQVAQIAHFANLQKPKVTVLEQPGSTRVDKFLQRYPGFNKVIDFQRRDFLHDLPDAAARILAAAQPGSSGLLTVALCWDSQSDIVTGEGELFRRLERDDATNMTLALSLHQSGAGPRTLLFQTRRCGFATLFSSRDASDPWSRKVRVFGTIEETCSLDTLMHESTDAVARVLHDDWYDSQIKAGKKHGDKPALWPWEQLDEMYKESNRHAADHISVKLRAIGYSIGQIRNKSTQPTTFDSAQTELLAEMEHARWCAELVLMGYTHAPGPRDDNQKTHPDLIPWSGLTESAKDYDRRQVQAIPLALKRAGLGLYRDPS